MKLKCNPIEAAAIAADIRYSIGQQALKNIS